MFVDLDLDRCIVCGSDRERNIEHVLPHALGGRLQARLLCIDCNSRFGETLVAELVSDPGIVIAVQNLRHSLPALHASIMTSAGYVAPGPDGKPIHIRNQKLRARRTDDGTILMETSVAPGHLSGMLDASGVSSHDIEQALARFADIKDGQDLDMGGGIVVRKTSVESVSPDLSAKLVDERWSALAALEYLAFEVGSLVLSEACDPLREYVRSGELPDEITVERLLDREYDARHAMYWSQTDDSLDFLVRLFRAVVFRVRLKRIRVRTALHAYVEDLDSGKSLLSASGLSGPFVVLNP